MVDLCYWYHVRKSCKFGARCLFVHETTYDPNAVYYTCTIREKRVLKNEKSVFPLLKSPSTPSVREKQVSNNSVFSPPSLPPTPTVVIISFKKIVTDHDGYCSGADDFTETVEYGSARRYNTTDKSDMDFAINEFEFDGSSHCCCGCGNMYEILSVERGLERWPKPFTTFDQVILLPLPGDLMVVIQDFLGDTLLELM